MATVERGELLSQQVEDALREKIREESLAPGEQLPPEDELAAMCGVSRATERGALASLQRGGGVRRQGAGTYVTRAAAYLDSRLEEMWSCEDMIRARGCEPGVGWLEYEETLPDRRTREKLVLGPKESVLIIRKIFLADGRPVIHCVDFPPRKLIQKPFTKHDLPCHVFGFLEEFGGRQEPATMLLSLFLPWPTGISRSV